MQTQRGHQAATIRNSKSHSFSEKDALQALAAATPRLRRATINTLEGWSSEAFLRQKAGQSFKKLAQKVKKETPGNEGHRWNSQRLKHPMKLRAIWISACGRHAVAAATIREKTGSAKAQRKAARRAYVLDCGSFVGLSAHREVRSQGCEIRCVEWRAE